MPRRRARAESLLKQAQGGADFAALARENSDDIGSKAQGGDLGWSTREAYEAPFADALFAMQKGEIRGPVRTRFGYHIIRLEDVRPRVSGRSRKCARSSKPSTVATRRSRSSTSALSSSPTSRLRR